MSDFNIQANTLDLDSLIAKIKKDNIGIEERLKRINEIINKLDKNVWDSPEKKSIEEEFMPFVSNNVNNISTFLKDCTSVLEMANEKYKEDNLLLKKGATKLNNIDVV